MGPLQGLKVVEIAGIGPGPFAAMMLADLGADVVRIDRAQAGDLGIAIDPRCDLLNRGKRSVLLDLKTDAGRQNALQLIERADALIEGFRPGVMERLGLGPQPCLQANPALVYGRITGWGQHGPMAQAAGHDIGYIALSGALSAIGRAGERPVPPLNLVGDFGGGGMYLALGIVCALWEAQRSGLGQVIDAAMVDGVASLMTFIHGLQAGGQWGGQRGENLLDGGAPWYDTYRTRDGGHMAVGAIEERFYVALLQGLELDAATLPARTDKAAWPLLRDRFTRRFAERTRDQWAATFEGLDACVVPVLGIAEAAAHPHLAARATFVEHHGRRQPAPAPRFSRTPGELGRAPPLPGEHTSEVLREWGAAPAKRQR